ncbi:MAG: gluconate permease, partial [Selenomonadaceae bacterium]|nr:gluconate permease [Selenomonadaceae bacterium]
GVGLSLPNDSGFWVVNRFSGFTFPQTMKAWTVGGFVAGLTGLAVLLVLSMFQNVLPGLM